MDRQPTDKPQHGIEAALLAKVLFDAQEGPRVVLLGLRPPNHGAIATLRRTSPVVRIDGNRVETENSVYFVADWAPGQPDAALVREVAEWGGDGLALH